MEARSREVDRLRFSMNPMIRLQPVRMIWALLLIAALLSARASAGAPPRTPAPATPTHRLPLERYGYRPTTSTILQREGYSMETLDYIDDEHVLLTFNVKKLIPRLAEDRETDQDRLVRALVLHLPDGKVVHEAEWRTHDRNQYLWPLAHGNFLLRVRNELFFVDPIHGRESFERRLLLASKREIEVIATSPTKDMLLVETAPERHVGDDPTEPLKSPPIRGDFYSVTEGEHPALHLRATIEEEKPFLTAFTSRGFLGSVQEDRSHWGFDFQPFGGKKMELAGFTSSCRPHAEFLTDSTFIATGCRGGDDRRLLAGFDLLAQANWVFTTDDPPVWPAVVACPSTGRFAMRNTMLRGVADATVRITPEEVRGQEIRVMQFRGGVELLRVPISPLQRPAQSFSLSPDGRRLAILHDGNLEVYALPAPDAADLREVQREAELLKNLRMPGDGEIEIKPEKRVVR